MIVDLKEYLKTNILDFRKKSASLKPFNLPYIEVFIPEAPVQIVALKLVDLTVLIIFHNKQGSDMQLDVFDVGDIKKLSMNNLADNGILTNYGNDLDEINQAIVNMYKIRKNVRDKSIFAYTTVAGLIGLKADFFASPTSLSEHFISIIKSSNYRIRTEERIGRSVDQIKQEAESLPSGDLRDRILEQTSSLEQEMVQLRKRLDDEMSTFRKIIGNSTDFQDFRIFSEDVTDLKKTHVPREVFDSKVSELNTRINAFVDMKKAYEKMLSQQNEFMQQQSTVMSKQAEFMQWVKYATILLPVAVILVPVLEIIKGLLGL
jgi:hypothetical protein